MVQVALDPAYRRVSVEEFLGMDFGGAKAELEDGVIRMMAGGSPAHARLAANIVIACGPRLRGTGCRPYGSDLAARTEERTVRFPCVSIYCNDPSSPENERKQLLGDPQVVFEILSPSTRSHDQTVKLAEYQALPGIREIVFVDPDSERIRLIRRTSAEGWTDDVLATDEDLALPSLGVIIPRGEVFARD